MGGGRRSPKQLLVAAGLLLALVIAVGPYSGIFQAEAGGILSNTPVAKAVAAGGEHACAIYNDDGRVYCWGNNDHGQLGNGTQVSSSSPVAVDMTGVLKGLVAKKIAAGFAHTCVIAGNKESTTSDKAYCWGANDRGQLGNGTNTDSKVPVLVDSTFHSDSPSGIYAGFTTTCATNDINTYCWGDNDEGQYGDGTTTSQNRPDDVYYFPGFIDLAIGISHMCVANAQNFVVCSGAGLDGQLGYGGNANSNGSKEYVKDTGTDGLKLKPKAVSAGYFMSCMMSDEGGFYCWGDDTSGQLGGGGAVNEPKLLKDYDAVLPIDSGYAHSCAGFECIGENGSGQLGDGTTANKSTMTAVVTNGVLNGLVAKDVSAGFDFTCWLAGAQDNNLSDQVYCSGAGNLGQLGNKATTNSSVPVAVDILSSWPMTITDINPTQGTPTGGTTVTLTGINIIAPPITPTTMQEMTAAYCASMPVYPAEGSTITLTDTRNSQQYQVRKLADNNCWMIDNLQLELTDGMTLMPAETNVASETTVYFTQDGTQGGAALPNLSGNFTTSAYLTLDGTGSTDSPNQDAWRQVDPTDNGYCKGDVQDDYGNYIGAYGANGCGYLYNFYTATAGTAPQTQTTGGSLASGSICPANWQLPSSNANDPIHGDFANLDKAYGGPGSIHLLTTPTDQNLWLSADAFRNVFSGNWNSYASVNQGTEVYLWSRSVHASLSAGNLKINSISVDPNDDKYRLNGFAVRCVADVEAAMPTPIVTFGGMAATNVSVVDNGDGTQTITATTPEGTAGTVDVVVSNGVDPDVTLEDAYTYDDPVYISLALSNSSGSATDSATLSGPPNLLLSDYITANTKTNNPTGYTLDISASEPRLKCSSSNDYFDPLVSTGAITDNHWGYATSSDSLTPPVSWSGVTTAPTIFQTYGTAPDQTLGKNTTLWFAARANYFLPACTYTGVVTVTAVAGP